MQVKFIDGLGREVALKDNIDRLVITINAVKWHIVKTKNSTNLTIETDEPFFGYWSPSHTYVELFFLGEDQAAGQDAPQKEAP